MIRRVQDLRKELVAILPTIDSVLSTQYILYGAVLGEVATICSKLGMKKALLLADDNTYPLLGKDLVQKGGVVYTHYILPPRTPPTEQAVEEVVSVAKEKCVDSIIVVGSGTLNDIAKYASFLLGVPYMVLPTAPSMNGYISANASIIKDGFRTSVQAQLPVAVLCDAKTLSKAPWCLIQSGIGDSLCRSTVQIDWRLSHLFLGTAYSEEPFLLLSPYEEAMMEWHNEKDVRKNIKAVMLALLAGGIGMVVCGGSYPASQGEHMWAHAMEMAGYISTAFHGEDIAVTSWYMLQAQEALLLKDVTPVIEICSDDMVRSRLQGMFSPVVIEECVEAYAEKRERLLDKTLDWELCRRELQKYLGGKQRLERLYDNLVLPSHPDDVGWNKQAFLEGLKIAKFTRNRFTFLDFHCEQEFLLDESITRH